MRRLFITLACTLAALSAGLPDTARAACRPDRAEVLTDAGRQAFRVALAVTPEERARGLMQVPEMPLGEGMLFLFEREAPRAFWMRNTLIPLDIIFFDATGRVTAIQADAQPMDETSLPGGEAQYVLEINGGLAARMGIDDAAVLRHPAIDQDIAAAPCE